MVYCTECGSKLSKKLELYRFNPETGEKEYRVNVCCPKKRWYNDHTDGYDISNISKNQILVDKNGCVVDQID